LVVIAIIGILVALLLPAIQSAREAARRTECSNHLKQIALAAGNYESTFKILPAGSVFDESPTWFVFILPFMEEQALFDQWNLEVKWHEATNRNILQQMQKGIGQVKAYRCPTRTRGTGEFHDRANGYGEPFPVAPYGDYAGNKGTWDFCCDPKKAYPHPANSLAELTGPPGNGWGFSHDGVIVNQTWPRGAINKSVMSFRKITDGLSKTFLVGEKHIIQGKHGPTCDEANPAYYGCDGSWAGSNEWAQAMRLVGRDWPLATGPNDDTFEPLILVFGSWHPGICQFATCDGAVSALEVSIDAEVLQQMGSSVEGAMERVRAL
jgi:type II secretory pathway pseudopilin PulG